MPHLIADQQTGLGMFFSSFSPLCFGGCLLVQCLATFCRTELGGEASLLLANQKFANRPLLPLDLQDILPLPPSQSYLRRVFFGLSSPFSVPKWKCSAACQSFLRWIRYSTGGAIIIIHFFFFSSSNLTWQARLLCLSVFLWFLFNIQYIGQPVQEHISCKNNSLWQQR